MYLKIQNNLYLLRVHTQVGKILFKMT